MISWTAAHQASHPSLSPGVDSNSCLLSWWCYLTILSPANLFSSCPQSFPASGSFPMSQFFAWGGQSIRASASVLPMNIQGWFPLGLAVFFSLVSKGLSRVLQHYNSKASMLLYSALWSNSHSHTQLLAKPQLSLWTFTSKVISLFLKTLSRSVSFPSKEQVSFNFMAAVTVCNDLGAQENKMCRCLHSSPIYLSIPL